MTIYIEDLIERAVCTGQYFFNHPISTSPEHRTLLESFSDQLILQHGLTDKQKKLSITVLKKYSTALSDELNINVEDVLKKNLWRTPSRQLQQKVKKIELIKKDRNYLIHLTCPYDTHIIEAIKLYQKNKEQPYPGISQWVAEEKIWKFPLSEESIKFFTSLPQFQHFQIDSEILELYEDIKKIEDNIELYVPMVKLNSNGEFSYENVYKNIPQPKSQDLISVLLDARKYGINMWDNYIEDRLREHPNQLVTTFLKTNYTEKLIPSAQNKFSLTDLLPIINIYDTILIVIPGVKELENLKSVKDFLIETGYTSKQMSVLFRLDSHLDIYGLNNYIKEENLNNELSDDTKFIFVSGKLPKPLIESKKIFDLVINYGLTSSHYSLQNFLKDHHNVINMGQFLLSGWNYVQL